MYYLIERTFLTDADGRSDRQYDLTPYMVPAPDANVAVIRFMQEDQSSLHGDVTELPGDKAAGTGRKGTRFFVIFAQRAPEALAAEDPRPAPAPGSTARPAKRRDL